MTSSAANKTPQQTPMVVPSHGRGKLRVGGTNKGGTGRPPSAVRKACTLAFDQRIKVLTQIADGAEKDADRIKAIDVLGKYGLGTKEEHELTQNEPLKIVHEHVLVESGPRGQHIRPLNPLEVKQLGP